MEIGTKVIVRVAGYTGDLTGIDVWTLDPMAPARPELYCIGTMGEDGVIALIDHGYSTAAEARAAWPELTSAR